MSLSQEQLAAERKQLDEEWAKLRAERALFESERKDSGMEYKLFIGNLDETTEEDEVTQLFSAYGEIKETVMLKGRDGKSKRSCFIKYFTKQAAEASVEALNGKHKDKDAQSMLVVRYARDKPAMAAAPQMQSYGQYGQQQQSYGGMSSGYSNGFDATGGMGGAMGGAMGGGAMGASGGMGGGMGGMGGAAGGANFGRGPPGANLYINNLSRAATDADVNTMFGDFGRVVSVKMFPDHGYGFVSYDNVLSAQNAISCLNGLAMGDGSKRLEVSVKKEKGAGGSSRFAPY